jgi:hypothetical protein
MTLLRLIPIHVHAVLETVLAPIFIVAPFVLGLSPAALVASVVLGVLLMGTALSTGAALSGTDGRGVRVSSHASIDMALATAAAGCAIGFALAQEPSAALFFGTMAILQSVLTTTTRYATLPA